jgi:NAD(P)-dependent dehydrogenase (short-subunit alcohol dehydrogenase family)
MAIDYAADGIRVVPPIVGSVDTGMSRQHALAQGLPPGHAEPGRRQLGRMAEPAEVARVIAFLTRFFEPEQNLYMEGWSRDWTVSADYRATGDHALRITNQERGGPGGWPFHGS